MPTQDLVPYDPEKLERDKAQVEEGFWDKLRRYARHVPFVQDAVAVYHCAMDPSTPTQVKAVLFGALAYFVLPFDFLPDLLPWLGFTDDAAVLFAAIRTVAPHITEKHRTQARETLARNAGPSSRSGETAA